jgi:hypothetical protein
MSEQKIGRNDPCHCGSGRKYKHCHMRADLEAEREIERLRQAARWLRQDLVEFAQDERFAVAFAAALPVYWDNYYTIETAEEMSENEALRFFDWFAFDYDQDGAAPRLVEVYREEMWDELSQPQQQVVTGWADAGPASAYTLTGYDGQILHLRDFLTGDTFDVYEPRGRGNVEVGDVILARLLPVHDRLELSGGAAYIPEDEIGDLRAKMEAARTADAEAHPDATHEEFLRRNSHLFIHHALAAAEAQGRPPVARLDDE